MKTQKLHAKEDLNAWLFLFFWAALLTLVSLMSLGSLLVFHLPVFGRAAEGVAHVDACAAHTVRFPSHAP